MSTSTTTNTAGLLEINPPKLIFPFELEKPSFCLIELANKSGHYIAFRIKLPRRGIYSCEPESGVILPRSTLSNVIIKREVPMNFSSNNEITLHTSILSPEIFTHANRFIRDHKLPILFLSKDEKKTFKNVPTYDMFIKIDPGQLLFPLQSSKRNSSFSIQLSNRSFDEIIVFMFTTATPDKYGAEPCFGVLQPQSTCKVTFTMKIAPRNNLKCDDMFLLRKIRVSSDFIRQSKSTDEVKLEVVLHERMSGLPTQPPLLPPPRRNIPDRPEGDGNAKEESQEKPSEEKNSDIEARQELIMKLSKMFKEKSSAWTTQPQAD